MTHIAMIVARDHTTYMHTRVVNKLLLLYIPAVRSSVMMVFTRSKRFASSCAKTVKPRNLKERTDMGTSRELHGVFTLAYSSSMGGEGEDK